MATNPYLQGMADDIGRRSNTALQQGLQGIRSNSVMGGGLGGSRQGVAEGSAITGSMDSLQGNLANMYNADYQAGENRTVQRYGIDSQAETSRYASDKSLQGSIYGAESAFKIAGLNNATTQRGQDQNYKLGLAQNEIGSQNANTNAAQAANQYALGQGQNDIGRFNAGTNAIQAANQYSLGQGQNAIGQQNANTQASNSANQYELGTGQNANQADANRNNYNLGMGKLGLDANNSANQYDLGLRDSDYRYAALDANTYQNNFNNQVTGVNLGLNAQDRLQANNAQGVAAGTALQNTPLDYYKTFTNTANGIGQGYGTESTSKSSQGDPFVSALGGAQLGSQFVKNLGFGSTPAVTDGGYSIGQGSAYGGSRQGL